MPQRASRVELLGEMSHSGYRDPPRLARRGDGQTLQLTPLLYAVLAAIDGIRNLEQIAEEVSKSGEKQIAPGDVAYLINEKLAPLGVVRDANGNDPVVEKANPLLALRCRLVVSNPSTTNALTKPFTWLFHAPVVALVLAGFVASVVWLLFSHGLGIGLRNMLYDPKQLVLVVGLAALSAGFHELGHAAACRYGGATPGVMGAGIYIVWPAFYTDVTDSYRLDRRGRLRTDLGGLYFNCIFTIAMVGFSVATGAESLLVLVPLQLLQMVQQLVPILRLDGYHILADLTGVPDLFSRIRPTLASAVPGRATDERAAALRKGARRVVTAWVLVVVPLLIFAIGSAALALPRILATAYDSLSLRWDVVSAAWMRSDVFAMVAGLLSMIAIVLPIAGTIFIVQRIVSRTWRYLWDRLDSRPARSALAAAALVTAVALIGALWPNGDYRPIQPGERWIVQELPMVRAAATGTLDPLISRAPPQAAPVSTEVADADGTAAGVVVEGDDNLALAVNTADGASIFRLAFAVQSIVGETVDQTNAAVALASCQACTTVAVAFQVLLVFGQSDTIVPENRAVALNVACQACVTFALATQLILGFDQPMQLTAEGEERLQQVHASLLALEEAAGSLDAASLATAVAEAKDEVAAILEEELVPVAGETADESEESEEDPAAEEEADTGGTYPEEVPAESARSTTTTSSSTTSSSTSTTSAN